MLSSLAITHTPVLSVLVTHPGQARTHTAAGPYRKALGKDGRRRSTYNAHTHGRTQLLHFYGEKAIEMDYNTNAHRLIYAHVRTHFDCVHTFIQGNIKAAAAAEAARFSALLMMMLQKRNAHTHTHVRSIHTQVRRKNRRANFAVAYCCT